jgi:TolA-binding protein
MTTFADVIRAAGAAALFVTLGVAATPRAQTQEDSARRRLESGRDFMRAGNSGEALKDFQVVLQTYPTSSVADDALLEMATYHLEKARDPRTAEQQADLLLKQYSESDSAPMALVLKGRCAMAAGTSAEQVNAAIASFDRVPRLYEGTDAVPVAMYWAGEAARLGGRRDEAIDRFGRLATQYPSAAITSRALLGSAMSLIAASQPVRAMEQLQRVRQAFPSSDEAKTALEWNTILYRLYVRAPAQPVYSFNAAGAPATKLRDVEDIAIGPDNNLRIAAKTGITTLSPAGTTIPFVAVQQPRGMFVGRDGRLFTLHEEGMLRVNGQPGIVLATAADDGRLKPLDLEAGAALSSGDLLVADRETKTLLRFSADGKPGGEFAKQIVARQLAVSELDDVAALDTDSKTVTIFGRDGNISARIPERGTGYQLRQPMDVAFDRLGHIYVLDRAAVLVFALPGPKLLSTFSVPERTPGAFTNAEALALDSAARLYVFDGRSDSVQVYR